MHGLGNDFVVINALEQAFKPTSGNLQFIADRRRGIGCDQVLLIEACEHANADFRYRIFNADGQEVEQCGNGVRCVGSYLSRHGLYTGNSVRLDTINGIIRVYSEEDGLVKVDMGVPVFEPEEIPIAVTTRQDAYSLVTADDTLEFMAVSMGNPHAVLLVDDVEQAPVEKLGPLIQSQAMFPQGVNVGFMQIIDPAHIRLRVYERGVGETQACGTGACGAVATGIITGRLESEVEVELRGGDLCISWAGEGQALWMTGPATTVYEGQIDI